MILMLYFLFVVTATYDVEYHKTSLKEVMLVVMISIFSTDKGPLAPLRQHVAFDKTIVHYANANSL